MDLNYVRRFSAYVNTFYYSEYIANITMPMSCSWSCCLSFPSIMDILLVVIMPMPCSWSRCLVDR